VTLRFGKKLYRVEPGHATSVAVTVDARGPRSFAFSSARGSWLADMRAVSVLSSPPHFARAAGPTARATRPA
jgi:hypothetical protein